MVSLSLFDRSPLPFVLLWAPGTEQTRDVE